MIGNKIFNFCQYINKKTLIIYNKYEYFEK